LLVPSVQCCDMLWGIQKLGCMWQHWPTVTMIDSQ